MEAFCIYFYIHQAFTQYELTKVQNGSVLDFLKVHFCVSPVLALNRVAHWYLFLAHKKTTWGKSNSYNQYLMPWIKIVYCQCEKYICVCD